ncbi:MAG: Tm-1-like ATP-binding domain-containing protein, partial [Anaerolineae bacterium]
MAKTIVILATLDTKSEEVQYLKERIARRDVVTLLVDAGVLGQPCFTPDVASEEVARRGGSTLQQLRASRDEGKAIEVMSRGATEVVR